MHAKDGMQTKGSGFEEEMIVFGFISFALDASWPPLALEWSLVSSYVLRLSSFAIILKAWYFVGLGFIWLEGLGSIAFLMKGSNYRQSF